MFLSCEISSSSSLFFLGFSFLLVLFLKSISCFFFFFLASIFILFLASFWLYTSVFFRGFLGVFSGFSLDPFLCHMVSEFNELVILMVSTIRTNARSTSKARIVIG
jgi:hypothetical protein